MDSPIHADHVTYHHHSGPETPSEAAANYAGAAFLIGMTVMAVGAGIGFVLGGFKKEPKEKDVTPKQK